MEKEYNEANWRNDAACLKADPELFFPDGDQEKTRQAVEVCGRCAVRLYCLQNALKTNERYGIRGGVNMSDTVRSARLKQRLRASVSQ